ncbi:hypothetical protein [Tuwongella immobilis]|uniref:Uncharacterized protein n=1 Tax=Tuwongella immobilis TaxID=692036 RepID=A0A6C2YV20_9BACT|nr:hypothetical protein [Tuwongella immobilis]VIP05013.1 Uncharacterized protein OS=Planctomyces limnophilus (strain ATCC 43296 / DSM 3776 / IFAM 1008 / 290) GN=Plim_2060 PE=4 SV=1 [Tuwongella immobilis]VTS07384.1 Uncharacterized protein OS=Planctomyces limnophilus (strain ATCC 43296 / DSM 3776 / IFAM 1008 / 290) GN=Plim_2060 PE=4 SV=1 [Tuwongella immobilis]
MSLAHLTLAMALLAPAELPKDVTAINFRKIQIPMQFNTKVDDIREVVLFVSRGKGTNWDQVAVNPPTKTEFIYEAPEDGMYWFSIMIIDKNGRRDPVDLYSVPPAQKLVIDTQRPGVRLTTAERIGSDIRIVWDITETLADLSTFQLEYATVTPQGTLQWQPISVKPTLKGETKFRADAPVRVRLKLSDYAQNVGEAVREVAGQGGATVANGATGANAMPNRPLAESPMAVSPSANLTALGGGNPAGSNLILPPAPPSLAATPPLAPAMPDAPTPGLTLPDLSAPNPPQVQPNPMVATRPMTPMSPVIPAATNTIARSNPPQQPSASTQVESPIGSSQVPVTPKPSANPPMSDPAVTQSSNQANAPLAVSNPPEATPPQPQLPRVETINITRFDLNYSVEEQGPSGLGRVDLYLTRDDGRTWVLWATDDDKTSPITVDLTARNNPKIEGVYGFKIVLQSGAGLSRGAPAAGDAPDMRVEVDLTSPVVKIYQPIPDPKQRDVLVIRWEALDSNLAQDPITLEWSEGPDGPWRPMVSAAPVATDRNTVGISTPLPIGTPQRIANTGSYPWRLPMNMPTHRVYLRITAHDLAGNVAEARTPQPIQVDLNKPVAKIQGILQISAPRR